MMEFSDNKPIFKQIIDYAYGCIVSGAWEPGNRVPSVRELTVTLGVNARTVMKAFDELQASGIMEPRRGMGYTLHPEARVMVTEARRAEFFSDRLPALIEDMKTLDIPVEELVERLRKAGL